MGAAPLPVTIVGGYLGSGKTTLINHLLRHADGLKLAILVNDFGELPIDADLIEAEDDQLISLSGGCVCCSYGNDLTMALIDLEKMQPRPDHVVLETSGVALPGAIAGSLSLLAGYRLDGVVVVADAETVREKAADKYVGDTILRQLGDADIVVLNKVDLAGPEALASTREWLPEQARNSVILGAQNCRLPRYIVLQPFTRDGITPRQAHHHPEQIFETATLELPGGCSPETVGRLLAERFDSVIRAKGFVAGNDGETRTVQVVGHRFSVSDAPDDATPGLVIIGFKPFDSVAIQQALLQSIRRATETASKA